MINNFPPKILKRSHGEFKMKLQTSGETLPYSKTIFCFACQEVIGIFTPTSKIPDGVILNSTHYRKLEEGIHFNCMSKLLKKVKYEISK